MIFSHSRCVSGPIMSRRLGLSLGVNLLPDTHKICNYNCIYCECGLNEPELEDYNAIPSTDEISTAVEKRLQELLEQNVQLNSITFSGNGEPTLHPLFLPIMKEVCRLRNTYMPHCPISVISNSTRIHFPDIEEALSMADLRILKLDAGNAKLYNLINSPRKSYRDISIEQLCKKEEQVPENMIEAAFNTLLKNLHNFPHPYILQTLFFRATLNGEIIDNTQGEAWDNYIEVLNYIKPSSLMIYGLDRLTPNKNLQKITEEELRTLALKLKNAGWFQVQYYY